MMKRILALFMIFVVVFILAVPALAAKPGDDERPPTFFHYLASFFKSIFVPSDRYFYNKVAQLNDNVNKKLGGVAQLYHIIENFLKSLDMPDAEASLSFNMPDNFYYDGYKGMNINIFSLAKPFVRLLKDVFNTGLCILTAIACYHKLRGFFTEQEA